MVLIEIGNAVQAEHLAVSGGGRTISLPVYDELALRTHIDRNGEPDHAILWVAITGVAARCWRAARHQAESDSAMNGG